MGGSDAGRMGWAQGWGDRAAGSSIPSATARASRRQPSRFQAVSSRADMATRIEVGARWRNSRRSARIRAKRFGTYAAWRSSRVRKREWVTTRFSVRRYGYMRDSRENSSGCKGHRDLKATRNPERCHRRALRPQPTTKSRVDALFACSRSTRRAGSLSLRDLIPLMRYHRVHDTRSPARGGTRSGNYASDRSADRLPRLARGCYWRRWRG